MGCNASSAAAHEPQPQAQSFPSTGVKLVPGQAAIIRNSSNASRNGQKVICERYNADRGEWLVRTDQLPWSGRMSLPVHFLEPQQPAPTLLNALATPSATGGPVKQSLRGSFPKCESLGVVVETGLLVGPGWGTFRGSHNELACTIESCSEMLFNGPRFENNCESGFKDLRRLLRNVSSDVSALDNVPVKAVVWNFILLVAEKRGFYKDQVAEVAKILLTSKPWREALQEKPELESAKVRLMGES
jgi:hypothetical protein